MTLRLTLALFALVALGCRKPVTPRGTVKLNHDARTEARVREPYLYNESERASFTGTPAGRYWFARCDDNWTAGVALETGKVSFTPDRAGKIELCVALREEAGVIDEYRFTVDVAEATAGARDANGRRDITTQAAAFARQLIALGGNVAKLSRPKLKRCPESLAAQPLNAWEEEYLVWLGKRARDSHYGLNEYERQLQYNAWLAKGGPYPRFLSSESPWRPIEDVALPPALDGHAVMGSDESLAVLSRAHAAVIVTTRAVKPVGSFGNFKAGSFTGWLVIGDLSTGRPICQAPLQYGSSSRVSGTGKDDVEALTKAWSAVAADFDGNGRTAARAALAKISSALKLSHRYDDATRNVASTR